MGEVRGAAAVPIKGTPGLLACAPGVDSGDRSRDWRCAGIADRPNGSA